MTDHPHLIHQKTPYKWSNTELTYLREAFEAGVPLKQMAETLGRSISSVHRTLSRHGIRQDNAKPLPLRRKQGRRAQKRQSPCAQQPNLFSIGMDGADCPPITYRPPHPDSIPLVDDVTPFALQMDVAPPAFVLSQRTGLPLYENLSWIGFEQLVEWLYYMGITVYYVGNSPLGPAYCYEIVDKRPLFREKEGGYRTKAQVVLIANKLRIERSLPVFQVIDILL